MRSLLGRFHRPNARSQSEQLFMLNSLGDGSTLSLDFTTGVLDPRLTFTRTTNATFINSQGYVQYADANMLVNSPMQDAATTPSSWNFFSITGGSISIPTTGSRKVEATASGQQPFAYQSPTVSQSLTYTLSLVVSEIVGSVTYANICAVDGSASRTLWVNGVQITNTATQAAAGNYCLVYVAGSGAHQHRIGVGASSATAGACSMTFHSARVQPGSFTTTSYVPSTLTSAYQGPRFDYDPTTQTPRGLLIEGSATNYVTQSNGSTSVWTTGGNCTPTNNTTDLVSPDGTNNATKLVCGTAPNYASFATSISGLTGGATYTISYWIRGPVGHSPRLFAQNGTTGDVTATATTGTYNNTGWMRLTQTYTLPATTTQVLVYFLSTNIVTTGDTFYVYGFQMETGSGASSHIPTGASQGFRAFDYLLSASSSGASRSTEFSLDDLASGTSALNEYTVLWVYERDPNSKQTYPASLFARTNANIKRADFRDFSGTTVEMQTQTRTVQSRNIGTASIAKVALAQNTSAYQISAINGTSATLTSGVIDSALGLQWIQLGNSTQVSGAFNPIWARQLKLYPTQLTAAQLQALTT